ncbi:MAG: DUF2147 domain-containing protein [Hyphomicrobiaceae bacterium]|nr:DUF2147 domain-containing protein [Hyphomicrobiaceae bacterium]
MATFSKSFSRDSMLTAVLAGLTLVVAGPVSATAADDPTGIWLDDQKRGAIEIKPCGKGLCGHVVWVKGGEDARGCGKKIIGDVAKVGEGEWDNGWIYSPERKKTYSVALEPTRGDKLKVVGYAGSRLFSKTMIWTRAPANLERCDSGTTVAEAKPEAAPKKAARSADPKPAQKVAAVPPARSASQALAAQEAVADRSRDAEPDIVAPSPVPASRSKTTADQADEQPVETAEADTEGDPEAEAEEAEAPRGRGGKDLDVSRYFRKAGKTCTIDAPFVKVSFPCEK